MFNRNKRATFYYLNYGPTFGNNNNYDIIFKETLLQGCINANKDSNFFEFRQLELLQEKGEIGCFDTKEIEVFNVIYE